jgi:hypothetical protein
MRVKMKESRGQGNATASVAMGLTGDDARTSARIDTDVELSGRVAAMGRGVIQDVSSKLVTTFAGNLQTMLAGDGASAQPEPAAAPAAASELSPGPAATSSTDDQPPVAPPPPPRRPEADEALDLGSIGGQVVVSQFKDPRRLAGLLIAVAAIALLLGRRRRG